MDSPASRLTPLEDDVPLPFDAVESLSSSVVTTRSRTRKRAAVDPGPRPTKKSRKGKEVGREPSGSHSQGQTMTEQAERRRADLLGDPRARMIDLYNVQCLKCGVRIKLSQKGLYDLHHWDKHRKRCNKWTDAYAARKRAENGIDSSRLSTPPATPPLTEDFGTEFTGTSARSVSVSARSPTPEAHINLKGIAEAEKEYVTPPREAQVAEAEKRASPAPWPCAPLTTGAAERREENKGRTKLPIQPRFPLNSHQQCADAMSILHPGLEPLDLNRPLPEVPAWSWGSIKPSTTVFRAPGWAQESVLLSTVDWED